jgi:hypothetical protein
MKLEGRAALSELSIIWNVVFVPDVLESNGTGSFDKQQDTKLVKAQKEMDFTSEKREIIVTARLFF